MSDATQNTPSRDSMEAMPVMLARAPSAEEGLSRYEPETTSPIAAAAVISEQFPIIAESLSAAVGIERGQRVIELGAGSGHIAISAGRRGSQVTSVVPRGSQHAEARLERDKEIARAENLAVDFWRWPIATVPFDNGDFDVVASSFAAMFASDRVQMAQEMLRLCRPGGRIGIASWTPDSFVAQLLRQIAASQHSDDVVAEPFRWGTAEGIDALFGAAAKSVESTVRKHVLRYETARQCLDIWCATFEPLRNALGRCDAESRDALRDAVRDLIDRCNTATDGRVALSSPYLEAVIRKRASSNAVVTH